MRSDMKVYGLALLVLALALACCGGAPYLAPASPPVASSAAPAPRPPAPAEPPTPAPPMTPGSVSVGEIVGPASFDPKPALTGARPALLACFTESRTLTPSLHGKLTLRVRVDEAGGVVATEADGGGSANDPGLVGCIGDAMKVVRFPKPGGTAVIIVPLVFRQ